MRDIFNHDIQIKNGIIEVLHRYSVYHLPLKAEEIYSHLPVVCPFSDLLVGLVDLEDNHIIFSYEGYFSLQKSVTQQVGERKVTFN